MIELGFDGEFGVEHAGAGSPHSAASGGLAFSTRRQLRQPVISLRTDHDVDERGAVQDFLRREGEEGYQACSDRVLARFLDGLVIRRRGRLEGASPRPLEQRITNNVVLKKLRVAFELQDADMHQVFEAAGFPVSKPELSALFRQAGHKNFRPCGDQMLRNFLKGLTLHMRGAQ